MELKPYMPTAKLERRACGRVEEAPNLSRISSQVALPHLPSLRAPREARSRRERHRSSGLASPLSFFTLPTALAAQAHGQHCQMVASDLLHHDGRAVCQDLRGSGGHRARGHPHANDRVRTPLRGLCVHALGRLGTRLPEQVGVGGELASHDLANRGEQVVRHVLRPHRAALHQTNVRHDPVAVDALDGRTLDVQQRRRRRRRAHEAASQGGAARRQRCRWCAGGAAR
eukprot:scaffold106740_cov70-Phaeocystis_antarctica.AAC.2